MSKKKLNTPAFQILFLFTTLLIVAGVILLIDQYLRFGYLFEISDVLHHESLIVVGVTFLMGIVSVMVALGIWKIKIKKIFR